MPLSDILFGGEQPAFSSFTGAHGILVRNGPKGSLVKRAPTSGGMLIQNVTLPGGTDVNAFTVAGSPSVKRAFIFTANNQINHLIMGGSWPAGSTFILINNALIAGKGGDGAVTNTAGNNGLNGKDGKEAILLTSGMTLTINNNNGHIFGGGGGGGSGGTGQGIGISGSALTSVTGGGGGGGGGAGADTTTGGTSNLNGGPPAFNHAIVAISDGAQQPELIDAIGNISSINANASITQLSNDGKDGGSSGLISTIGTGGKKSITSASFSTASGGDGGDGGDWGQDGKNGNNAAATGNIAAGAGIGGTGGKAGKAIELSGGNVLFSGGNNPSQVKGAVS